MRGGAVAQLRAQDCVGLQNHCKIPLFRQAPPQLRWGAPTGSTRVAAMDGKVGKGFATTVVAADAMATSDSIVRIIAENIPSPPR